jgi:hypothetical protein
MNAHANRLPTLAIIGACLPWLIFLLGSAYAFLFVHGNYGAGQMIDPNSNAVITSYVTGWWVSVLVFLFSLVVFFQARQRSALIAVLISGIYFAPWFLLYIFLALK